MRRFIWVLMAVLWPVVGSAQTETDRGFIAGLLEDALGGEGRTVRVEGFAGALSSTATVDRITIADSDGIWLSFRDVTLQWDRGALLSGQITINRLSAAEIDVPRLPVAAPGPALPEPEATPFKLPELPVSIQIDQLEATTIRLGAPVLGQAAELTLDAAVSLVGGSGTVDLTARRTDGVLGDLSVVASFANTTDALDIDIAAREARGGLVVSALGIPDAPDAQVTLVGQGTLQDFNADLNLATAGQTRLQGAFRLLPSGSDTGFFVDLNGDLRPLVQEEFRDFFGADTQLVANGARANSGALTLDALQLRTATLALTGQLALTDNGWPERFDVSGQLAGESGAPVRLPVSGDPVTLQEAQFDLRFDAQQGDAWRTDLTLRDLQSAAGQAGTVSLAGGGTIQTRGSAPKGVTADLAYDVAGFSATDPALTRALGQIFGGQLALRYAVDQPLVIQQLSLKTDSTFFDGQATIATLTEALRTRFSGTLESQDLARFDSLVGQPLSGAASLTLEGEAELGGAFSLGLDGETRDLAIGIAQADALIGGAGQISARLRRDTEGLTIDAFSVQSEELSAQVNGTIASTSGAVTFRARLRDVAQVVPGYTGSVALSGRAVNAAEGWQVDTAVDGPYGLTAQAQVDLRDALQITYSANLPDARPLGVPYAGAIALEGQAVNQPTGWQVVTTVDGPLGLTAQANAELGEVARISYRANLPDVRPLGAPFGGAVALEGEAVSAPTGWQIVTAVDGPFGLTAQADANLGERAQITYRANLPDVRPFGVPFDGPLSLSGQAVGAPSGWQVETSANGPYGLTAQANADLRGAPQITYRANLPDIRPLGAPFGGPLSLSGQISEVGGRWSTQTDVIGPAGTQARIAGQVAPSLALNAAGQLPLGLANPLIEPRDIQGTARFDLDVNGPSLAGLSGTVSFSDARFEAPTLKASLRNLQGTVTFARGVAQLRADSDVRGGGRIEVAGPITLTPSLPTELTVRLRDVKVEDPMLYETDLEGSLRVAGPLTGGAVISGDIAIGRTQISIPSTFLGALAPIPDVTHIGAQRPVMRTLDKARLTVQASGADTGAAARPFGLNITLRAPSRVFVRGRGLDAELGGSLRITGTTRDVVSSGAADLVRGRLDILGERFQLDEGRVQLLGDFDPFIRFVATTQTDAGTASVIVEGRASSPEVRFVATPELPEDEVLSQLLFGRDLSQISALQALELASAVATLAGRGGQGVVGRLRDTFNLDDLDITSNDAGETQLRAGKYISDNVYTDVTVGPTSQPEVSINIDLTPNLTARGKLKQDGETSLGIFFEKDY